MINQILKIVGVFIISFAISMPNVSAQSTGSSGSSSSSVVGSALEKFKYKNFANWGDCFDFKLTPLVAICPGFPPFPTVMFMYKYNDIVAIAEVVGDPWTSYLYSDSLFDFSNKSEKALAAKVGVDGTVGSGLSNTRGGAGKEFSGVHKYETHIWAVSDWWRMLSNDPLSACLSLSCKNEDYTGCILSTMNTASDMGEGMKESIDSINQGEDVDGKGTGVRNGETGETSYEDGSTYDANGNETRAPGNYGLDGAGSTEGLDTSFSSTMIAAQGAVETAQEVVAFAENPTGYVAGGIIGAAADGLGDLVGSVAGDIADSEAGQYIGGIADDVTGAFGGESDPAVTDSIADSTDMSGVQSQPLNSSSKNQSKAQGGTKGLTEGNNSSYSSAQSGIPGLGSIGGNLNIQEYIAYLDYLLYFSPIEYMISYISEQSPVMLWPVFMTERHQKTATTGGFISGIYEMMAEKGAGIFMPMFCMGQSAGMAVGGALDMISVNIPSSMQGLADFFGARCVGSWGPLEPRVTILGSGDSFVAAGIASVRGLQVAQNLDRINQENFNDLKFNLAWPHESKCYGFKGFDGLSRSWTTPLGGTLDNISSAVQSGDISTIATAGKDATIGNVQKTGGYVFTYWRKRKCYYLYSCDKWIGDTGGK